MRSLVEGGHRIKDIALAYGKTSSYICHLLRLLKLPEIVLDGYYAATISLSHLFILSRLKNQTNMIAAYEKVLTDGLFTHDLERHVREVLYNVKTHGDRIDKEIEATIEKKYASLDPAVSVSIAQTRRSASVMIRVVGSAQKTSEVLKKIARVGP